MSSYEGILLDCGGVLTENYVEADFPAELAAKFQVAKDDLMAFLREGGFMPALSTGRLTEEELVRMVTGRFSEAVAIDPDTVTSDNFTPSAVAIEAVNSLRNRTAAKLVLASNIFPSSARHLREWCLEGFFDKLYLSSEIGLRKPDPAYFEHIAADLQLPPEKLFFLDDMHDYVEGARSVGITAVQANSPQDALRIIESL